MLDIRRIRQEPEQVKAGLAKRGWEDDTVVDRIRALDEERRMVSTHADELKASQNRLSRQIPLLKREGKDDSVLTADLRKMSAEIHMCDQKIGDLEGQQRELLLALPNLPQNSVPEGMDADANVECRRWGEPRQFPYPPKAHWELGADLGLLDPERAGKVTGKRFHFLRGLGARLERAVINFYIDRHTARGYEEIQPPYLVNAASLYGTGQLPKFADDLFRIEGEDLYLTPTAEVPVTNYYRDEILDGGKLTIRHCAYTPCFRAESGAAGRDTRGLIRQRQFDKVELVKLTRPEQSDAELEGMTRDAEACLQELGLAYRVVSLCAGDLGFSSAKTYDIEVWMPSYERYVELSSCSNCEDFQARRAGIRYKDHPGEKAKLVHTLNGSGLAVGRTVAAILEQYQNDDGSVSIPEALRSAMGVDRIR